MPSKHVSHFLLWLRWPPTSYNLRTTESKFISCLSTTTQRKRQCNGSELRESRCFSQENVCKPKLWLSSLFCSDTGAFVYLCVFWKNREITLCRSFSPISSFLSQSKLLLSEAKVVSVTQIMTPIWTTSTGGCQTYKRGNEPLNSWVKNEGGQ